MSRDRMKRADDRTDEAYMGCSRDARLLYTEMAHDFDDGGVMPASPVKLKALAFPGDSDLDSTAIQRLMDELIQNRLVIVFEAEGRKFWHYLNWTDKQKVQRPTFRYPQPTQEQIRAAISMSTHGEFHEDSWRIPGELTEDSRRTPPELKGNEEKGNELNTPLPPKGECGTPEVDESPKSNPEDEPVVQSIVEAWNAIPDVPKVSKLTAKRLRALNARLKDSHFRANWPAGLQAISRSDFCRGRKPGASWRADFDWFAKPDSLVCLLEGKYDNPGGQPGSHPPAGPATTGIAGGPLLAVTADEATDPAAFDGWFERQRTFDRTDRNRQDFHALRCSVHRILRRPEVARNELQSRLELLAAGRQLVEPPRHEDIQQAARELSRMAAGPARENAPADSRDMLTVGGAA